jgi:1,4-alpha-glucan branching enzyme
MPLTAYTTPTTKPGMGAVLQDGGCSYRVWAPNASGVTLGGDFFNAGNLQPNNWQEIPMARDAATGAGAAYWSVFVPNAVADSLYKFKINNPAASPEAGPYWPYRHDPYARDATSFAGNSVVVDRTFDWSGDTFQMPPWNQLVIYELHVGTFNRAQPNQVGTFDQAKQRLSYVRDLGCNAVQLMPASDFDTTTSMGYNTALPFAIDNAYGQLNAMKGFILAAHQLGLAVIFDVVYNHFGPQGLDACLKVFDGATVPGRSGIYFYQDGRIYTPFGDRPDFSRGEVRQYLRDNAVTWLSELRCDGLRFDSTVGIRRIIGGYGEDNGPNEDGRTLLRYLGEEKRATFPWKILIAEDLQNDSSVTQDALSGGIGLDSQWDNWFLGRLENMMFATSDAARGLDDVAAAITKSYNPAGPFQRVIYTESHDQAYKQPRIPDRIEQGNANGYYARKRSTLGAALLMTSPGIPMIFMGQEFLEYTPWDDALGHCLDWNRVNSFSGIVSLYRRLIQLRRNFDNNTRGLSGANTDLIWVDQNAGVIVFRRYDQGGPGDDVLIAANLTNNTYPSYSVGFPREGSWYLRFNSDWQGYSQDFGNVGYDTRADPVSNMGKPFSGNIGLGRYSAVIYSQ